jgi:urease accessory protein
MLREADIYATPRDRVMAAMERGDGALELRARLRAGATRIAHLHQHDPGRILFPLPEQEQVLEAVLVITSGGLTGGDRLRIAVGAEAGASLSVAGQAAEKLYRSSGADCRISVDLSAAAGARLEYIPQETILFDGARLVRRQDVALTGDGALIAADMLVFGRTAHGGERFRHGLLHDSWRLRRDGRLVWADALRLEGDIAATLDRPFGFAGAVALATALYAGPGAADLLEPLRERMDGRAALTLVNGVLLMRHLARDAATGRAVLVDYLAALRQAAFGWPAQLPRVWHT